MVPDHETLRIPRESPNDDYVLLVEWLRDDSSEVSAGEPICSLETSKALIEYTCPRAGYLFHLRSAGEELKVGAPFAVVSIRPQRPEVSQQDKDSGNGVQFTRKARRLMEEHGLDVASFAGRDLVRERDVRRFLGQTPIASREARGGKKHPITPLQRRVAGIVELSYGTIPHSYLNRWMDARLCDRQLKALCASEDIIASISDLLVYAVAQSVESEPKINAAWGKDEILVHQEVNVGFALNLANGDLVVPAINGANRLPFDEVVGRIRGFQKKALKKKLSARDLTGGTITVTSLIGSGAHQIMPLIVPGQSAILGVGDRIEKLDEASYCLTLGFDHRVMNGTEAAQFLGRVAKLMTGERQ